ITTSHLERIEMSRMLSRDGSLKTWVKPAAVVLLAGAGFIGISGSAGAADEKADKPAAKVPAKAPAKAIEKDADKDAAAADKDAAATDKVTYAKDIQPLLKESCVRCHQAPGAGGRGGPGGPGGPGR